MVATGDEALDPWLAQGYELLWPGVPSYPLGAEFLCVEPETWR